MGSSLTFIEGFENKLAYYFDEANKDLNPIDMIVHCSLVYDKFDYSFENKVNGEKKKATKTPEETAERNKRITHIGDKFQSENFNSNYEEISHISDFSEELQGLLEWKVYKRKDIAVAVLTKEQKDTIKSVKRSREFKNKENMRTLIRDN